MLAWTPSSDSVGVVEYGLYASGVRVSTVSDANATVTNLACGRSYLVALDAADAAGNRSARVDSFLKTSPCPTTNKAPSAPTGVKVTSSTLTSMALAWSPSTDDVAVAGYGLDVSGQRTTDTTKTSADFTGLRCGTTYAMGIDAFDTPGKRSTVTELSAATSPCPSAPSAPDAGTAAGTSSGTATGTTTTEPATATAARAPSTPGGSLTQTIVGGSTLSGQVNWRAVYDRNGDRVSDDPGSMRFYVDGTLVLTEQNRPFGDTPGFWKSSSVADGRHTFEVRAIGRWGTVLATNTVTASVANGAPPNPQSTDTTAPTVAATAPTNGATVSGMINQAVNATDNVGVTKVEFVRDGVMYGSDSTAPYSASLNTTTVPNGSHTLGARAYDAAGNMGTAANVNVTVTNASTPPPDTTAPSQPSNLRVVAATATSVTIAWNPATDNVGVGGYGLYRGSSQVGQTQQATASYTGMRDRVPGRR